MASRVDRGPKISPITARQFPSTSPTAARKHASLCAPPHVPFSYDLLACPGSLMPMLDVDVRRDDLRPAERPSRRRVVSEGVEQRGPRLAASA
jgi:hypothetical protein